MIQFDLRGAHPAFERAARDTYAALTSRYPFVPLKRVSLYEPRGNDTSMGVTHPGGRIEFNRHWFAGTPDRLDDAAKHNVMVEADGTRIAWHGGMVDEPRQVLVHEFFHVMAQAVPKYADWARRAWLEATLHPELSPSGYALANPDEFWAEAMAARELGFEFGLLGPLEEFLRDSLPGYSAEDAEWSESDHPRAENGQFGNSTKGRVEESREEASEFQRRARFAAAAGHDI